MTDTGLTGPFTAEVDRHGRWWTIHIVELDVDTQAARWSEVEQMARGVVVAMLDLDDAADVAVDLVPVFDDEVGRLLHEAEQCEEQARSLAASAGAARRSAIQTLRASGWTLQGIAAGLGLSYQRVDQLLKSAPGPLGIEMAEPSRPRRPARAAVPGPGPGAAVSIPGSPRRGGVTGRYLTRSSVAHRARTGPSEGHG